MAPSQTTPKSTPQQLADRFLGCTIAAALRDGRDPIAAVDDLIVLLEQRRPDLARLVARALISVEVAS